MIINNFIKSQLILAKSLKVFLAKLIESRIIDAGRCWKISAEQINWNFENIKPF